MRICAAVIGTGIGIKHYDAIEGYKNSSVKIICEKDKSKFKILKNKYPNTTITSNDEDIFKDKDINLVSIASYDEDHFGQIIKCLNANKNIIIEKPICLSQKELKKIYKLAIKKKNLSLISNLVLRTNSRFKKIKSIINKKKDNIYYIEADYLWGRPKKFEGWRSKTKNYSIILGAAIHVIDLVMWMLNQKPKNVFSVGNALATKRSKFKGNSFELIILEFANGLIVKITGNGPCKCEHFHELKIFSEKYSIIHSLFKSNIILKNNKKKKLLGDYPDKENRKNLIRSFISDLIKNKKQSNKEKQRLFDLMTVCLHATKSSKIRKKIKLNYNI